MEFLLTYGWAIVVVLVAISALAYFGVLDPGKFMPPRCDLPTGLSCLDHRVSFYQQFGSDKNRLELKVKNNLGSTIEISKIEVTSLNLAGFSTKTFSLVPVQPMENGAQDPKFYVDDISSGNNPPATRVVALPLGSKYQLEFTIELKNTLSGLTHTFKGTAYGKIS